MTKYWPNKLKTGKKDQNYAPPSCFPLVYHFHTLYINILLPQYRPPRMPCFQNFALTLFGSLAECQRACASANCLSLMSSLSLLSSVTSSPTHILSPRKFLLYMKWHYHTTLHPQKFIFACTRNLSFETFFNIPYLTILINSLEVSKITFNHQNSIK